MIATTTFGDEDLILGINWEVLEEARAVKEDWLLLDVHQLV